MFAEGNKLGILHYNHHSKVLTWRSTTGSRILARYKCDRRPIDATICAFSNLDSSKDRDSSTTTSIAILTNSTSLRILCYRGDSYEVNLVTRFYKLTTFDGGLLLHRDMNYDAQSTQNPIPILYSLSHPLASLSPISFIDQEGILFQSQRCTVVTVQDNLACGFYSDKQAITLFVIESCTERVEDASVIREFKISDVRNQQSPRQLDLSSAAMDRSGSTNDNFDESLPSPRNQRNKLDTIEARLMFNSNKTSFSKRIHTNSIQQLNQPVQRFSNCRSSSQQLKSTSAESPVFGTNIASALGLSRTFTSDPDIDREIYRERSNKRKMQRQSTSSPVHGIGASSQSSRPFVDIAISSSQIWPTTVTSSSNLVGTPLQFFQPPREIENSTDNSNNSFESCQIMIPASPVLVTPAQSALSMNASSSRNSFSRMMSPLTAFETSHTPATTSNHSMNVSSSRGGSSTNGQVFNADVSCDAAVESDLFEVTRSQFRFVLLATANLPPELITTEPFRAEFVKSTFFGGCSLCLRTFAKSLISEPFNPTNQKPIFYELISDDKTDGLMLRNCSLQLNLLTSSSVITTNVSNSSNGHISENSIGSLSLENLTSIKSPYQRVPRGTFSSSMAQISVSVGSANPSFQRGVLPLTLILRESSRDQLNPHFSEVESDVAKNPSAFPLIEILYTNRVILSASLRSFMQSEPSHLEENDILVGDQVLNKISTLSGGSSRRFLLSQYQDDVEVNHVLGFNSVLLQDSVISQCVAAVAEAFYRRSLTNKSIGETVSEFYDSYALILSFLLRHEFLYGMGNIVTNLMLALFGVDAGWNPDTYCSLLPAVNDLRERMHAELPKMVFDSFYGVREDMLLAKVDCAHSNSSFADLHNALVTVSRLFESTPHGANFSYYFDKCLSSAKLVPTHIPSSTRSAIHGFTSHLVQVPTSQKWLCQLISCMDSLEMMEKICTIPPPYIPYFQAENTMVQITQNIFNSVFASSRLVWLFFQQLRAVWSRSCAAGEMISSLNQIIAEAFVQTWAHSYSSDSVFNLNLPTIDLAMSYFPLQLRALIVLSLLLCQEYPSLEWPAEICSYIGRPDVAMRKTHRGTKVSLPYSPASYTPSGPQSGANNQRTAGDESASSAIASESDGLAVVEAASSEWFPLDERVHEVCRILKASKHLYLRLDRSPEWSDADYRDKQQLKLLSLTRRALGTCVGRGMLTVQTLVPLMAEPLPIPPLVISGRCPPTNAIMTLDASASLPDFDLWPEFHNGAAAGLRIGFTNPTPLAELMSYRDSRSHGRATNKVRTGGSGVTRNWIMYNRAHAQASNRNTAHAGMLLALGLQGHLKVLTMNDICDYLTQGHEPTTAAVLIGVSASRLGSADPLTSKTLCLHLPALLPSVHWDLEISPLVQGAALTGLGLLYCGSGHRLMAELLLDELTREPTGVTCECREAIALSAAWSLGMVLLGKGSQASSAQGSDSGGSSANSIGRSQLAGLSDMHIEDRLHMLIHGAKRPDTQSSVFNVTPVLDANSRSSRVLEGDFINTEVTSIGATIALALIYLRSNNAEMAKRIALPTTPLLLDKLRPDLTLYRVLARCLILWDSVKPSDTWIRSQIPRVVCNALFVSDASPTSTQRPGHVLSFHTALAIYLNTTAGLCLGIALVNAGAAHAEAKDALLAHLLFLQGIRDGKAAGQKFKTKVVLNKSLRPIVESVVSTVALSLACVMAGSGDLTCLRTLRELRWKVEDVNYGTHLALNMALGMLCLGGGTASLRRDDPASVACLMLSLLPRYPMRTTDNQYHLQPLRHFYAVAMEGRALRTVDVDDKSSVPLDLEVELYNGSRLMLVTPCLLPELASVRVVRVLSSTIEDQVTPNCAGPTRNRDYFPAEVDLSMELFTSVLYVKRRPATDKSPRTTDTDAQANAYFDLDFDTPQGAAESLDRTKWYQEVLSSITKGKANFERNLNTGISLRKSKCVADLLSCVLQKNSDGSVVNDAVSNCDSFDLILYESLLS